VDRSEDLENILEKVLQNTEELKKLQADLKGKSGDAGEGA
jgi:predicted component of type VI protein secretion system